MPVNYADKTSLSALWCQRIAVFLLPYFAAVILLFRFSKVELSQLIALGGVGFILTIVALLLGLRAISLLWVKGYGGGTMAIAGLIIVLVILLPFMYFAFLGLRLPLANDVSTDAFNPPKYVQADLKRANASRSNINPVGSYDRDHALKIVAAYPKLQSRRYPAGPERVLEAVRAIVLANNWPVTGVRGIPEIGSNVEDDQELADNASEENTDNSVSDSLEVGEDMYLEFLERTPVFGFPNDVVVRIVNEDRNTRVDLRVSSRFGKHDLGYNARLIERFLFQLDTALLGIAGEG